MSLLDTSLGEDLKTALEDRLDDHIDEVVEEVIRAVWAQQLDQGQILEAISLLERHVRFADALLVGDAAIAVDLATFETHRRYCQTLIETGALHASEMELTWLAGEPGITEKEKGETLGLLGRLHKQRFVFTGKASDLSEALRAYEHAYDLGTDRAWHGANIVALLHRAEVEAVTPPAGLPDSKIMAAGLLDELRAKPDSARYVWDLAAEIELLISLGRADEAREVAEQLTKSRRFSPFHLGSLRRQLTEIWLLTETHPVLLALNEQLLQHGRRAVVDLPESPEGLEKIFGAALPIGYQTLLKGLRCSQSVCKITDSNGEGWGTGFLIDGGVINEGLKGEAFVATNAHVVSSDPGVGALRPVEAEARFDVLTGPDNEPVELRGLTELWTSPPDRCDVTLLTIPGDSPSVPEPISPAPALPLAGEGAFVYVVGHPAGAGLKLSIRGNDLLAYDGGKDKVHYTAPTEPGSSGSPVFSAQWQLMAVHHAGSTKMRRLDDPSKSYSANEGITLEAIRREFSKA